MNNWFEETKKNIQENATEVEVEVVEVPEYMDDTTDDELEPLEKEAIEEVENIVEEEESDDEVEEEPEKYAKFWIPIDGKHDLPEEGVEVLVIFRRMNGEITVLIAEIYGHNKNGLALWRSSFGYCLKPHFVEAWMPLPEPYISKGDKEETNGTESI